MLMVILSACQLWTILKSYKQCSKKCKVGLAKKLRLRTSNVQKLTHTDILCLKPYVIMSRTACDAQTPHCEWCERTMTEEDHDFCDICDECREENEID